MVFLNQAAERAIAEKKYIVRRKSFWGDMVKIKPTNTGQNCIVVSVKSGKPPRNGWQPKAEDLVADDWDIAD